MSRLLLILLLMQCPNCFCQDISSRFVERPDYAEFEGTIDSTYAITMLIYPSGKFAFGKYSYDKIGEKISLKGSIEYIYGFINGNYYEKEKLELVEYDEDENRNAVFEGEIIDKSIFKGTWTSFSNGKTLPFELKRSSYNSITKIHGYIFELKIDSSEYVFDFSKHIEFQPKIDTLIYKVVNEKYYFLYLISYKSKGDCYNRGNCGCGDESFAVYLTIDKDANSQSQQIIYYESCKYSKVGWFQKDQSSFTEYSGFDLDNFETYTFEVNDIRHKKEIIYELNSKCLDCGFRVISMKNVDY